MTSERKEGDVACEHFYVPAGQALHAPVRCVTCGAVRYDTLPHAGDANRWVKVAENEASVQWEHAPHDDCFKRACECIQEGGRQLDGVIVRMAAEIERLREALCKLDHVLSSPGSMTHSEVAAEGLRIIRGALEKEETR